MTKLFSYRIELCLWVKSRIFLSLPELNPIITLVQVDPCNWTAIDRKLPEWNLSLSLNAKHEILDK